LISCFSALTLTIIVIILFEKFRYVKEKIID